MMHILMLSWEYPPNLDGGLGAHVTALVPALAEQGVDLTLITPRFNGGAPFERIHDNAVVYRVDPPVTKLVNLFPDAQQTNLNLEQVAHSLWARDAGFDLIHAHDWLVSFAAKALKHLYKTPLIATIHATERGRGRGRIVGETSEAINGADYWLTYEAWRVITTSRAMAHEVREYFSLPSDKVLVIPNGVDAARFSPIPPATLAAFRSVWARPDEPIAFYVGRLQHEKGVHWLIEAADRLRGLGRRVRFVVAGRGTMEPFLKQRVSELGLDDWVTLAGRVPDSVRDELFRVADMAVFPSIYEPFGIVALEAMAAKCPVIVSDVGGLGAVVDGGVTGLKIPYDRPDILVDAILYVLDHPGEARDRAERAYEVVSRDYLWPGIARATMNLYEEIIAARRVLPWL